MNCIIHWLVSYCLVLTYLLNSLCSGFTFIGCYPKQNDLSPISYQTVLDDCISHCESLYSKYAAVGSTDQCFCNNTIPSRQMSHDDCDIRCPNLEYSCGGLNALSYYNTFVSLPGPSRNLKSSNAPTNSSLFLEWDLPESNELVSEFSVKAVPLKTYASSKLSDTEWIVSKSDTQFELMNLHPGTQFNVSVTSMANGKTGGTSFILLETSIGEPAPLPQKPKRISETPQTITIEIEPQQNINGPVSGCRIIVFHKSVSIIQEFNKKYLSDYQTSRDSGLSYYISGEVDCSEEQVKTFVVGDGKVYRGFYNAPLSDVMNVDIILGLFSKFGNVEQISFSHNPNDEQRPILLNATRINHINDEDSNVLLYICIFVAILLLIAALGYLYMRFILSNSKRISNSIPLDEQRLSSHEGHHEMDNQAYVNNEFSHIDFEKKLHNCLILFDSNKKIQRNLLRMNINNSVARGHFSDVIDGTLQLNPNDYALNSWIYIISDDMDSKEQIHMLRQLNELRSLHQHANILDFYGICQSNDFIYIIFEELPKSYKEYLLASRLDETKSRLSTLSEHLLLTQMYQLADAVMFLNAQNINNNYVSSYNIFVSLEHQVKLAVFDATLKGQTKDRVDITRWQAPEFLILKYATPISNVWSFGYVMWEACCLGGTFFNDIPTINLLSQIKAGSRPYRPKHLFDDMYQLFLNCWTLDTDDRISFGDIKIAIENLLTSPEHSISFNRSLDSELPPYNPSIEILKKS